MSYQASSSSSKRPADYTRLSYSNDLEDEEEILLNDIEAATDRIFNQVCLTHSFLMAVFITEISWILSITV